MPHGTAIADHLLSIGAVRLSTDPPFTWSNGLKAPIYCDNRMVYSHTEARDFVVDALVSRIKTLHIEPDVIAGTATAAIGWAALVADRLKLPFIYVRHKAKEHGAGKLIEGDLQRDAHVVVIEDLISTGGSAVRTADILRTEGKAMVTDIVAIFTYDLPVAQEKLREGKVRLHTLTSIATLIESALVQKKITKEQADLIGQFARDPEQWSAKNG